MAKKPIKRNKMEKQKELKENKIQKISDIKPKKFTLKVTSKVKKKLKFTQNKLNIDKLKLKKVISHLIKEEPPIFKNSKEEENEEIEEDEIKGEGGVPLYLFITLKKDLNDDDLKLIKNKLLKLKYSMINEAIYICLIEDKLTNEEKDKLMQLTNSRMDIITKDELKNNIKNIKDIDLENQYQIFISNLKNNIYLNKKWDILYYQSSKFEIIHNLIDKIYNGATIIKLLDKNKKILKIKFGYTNMNIEELEDNAYRTILKAISFTLSNSEKYNGVENILIKTKKSIPFNIFGNINAENINNYNI
jgi:hypothetical protein